MNEATLTAGFPTIPAEMRPRTAWWRCALDNYEPVPRREGVGTATEYRHDGEIRIRLENGISEFKTWDHTLFVVDDGRTVTPMYVIGYHHGGASPLFPDGHEPFITIGPLPTDYDTDGSPILRADSSRPVDFSNWMLGPRLTYHLKLRRE